jgi:hypothetical protein
MQPAPNQVVYVYNPSGNATPYGTTTTTTTGGTGMNVGITGPDGQTVGMNVGVTGTGMGNPGNTTTTTTGGSTTTTTTTTTTGGPGMNMGVTGPDGQTVGVNINMTGMGGSTTTTSQTTTTTTSTGGGTTTVVPAPTGNGCAWPMSSSDFASAKQSVTSKSFEDSKLTVAKQILSSNCMSSAQVKEIMMLFSFEQTKLDWAKFAYGKTTDPNNYFKLNDGFTFETSIDELNEYIKSH